MPPHQTVTAHAGACGAYAVDGEVVRSAHKGNTIIHLGCTRYMATEEALSAAKAEG
jgi:hypothetical protein